MTKSKPKVVALGAELDQLRQALEAARLVVQALEYESFETAEDAHMAPAAVNAALKVISTRLRDVVRAIHGGLDPAALWSPYNSTTAKPANKGVLAAGVRQGADVHGAARGGRRATGARAPPAAERVSWSLSARYAARDAAAAGIGGCEALAFKSASVCL